MFLELSCVAHEFCPNCWIWFVAMATKMLNLQKILKISSPQKPKGGWSGKFTEMFITFASTKTFFIYCHWSSAFVGMATKLIIGKVEVVINCCLTADIWQNFYRSSPWVVLYITWVLSRQLNLTCCLGNWNIKLAKKYSKSSPQKEKLKVYRNSHNICLFKNCGFFIAIAHVLSSPWPSRKHAYIILTPLNPICI